MHWSSEFADPVILPNGRKLVTLEDAATYITELPKKESALPEWQTAIEVLMLRSRGGGSIDPCHEALHRRRGARVKPGPQSAASGQAEATRDH
jgi:hypothetical protein